jgi:hypothetical protein
MSPICGLETIAMTVPVFINIVEGCAGLAAAVCWGTAAVISRFIFASTQTDEMVVRFRLASRWVVRASVLTAIASFGIAAGALHAIVTQAGG